MGVAAALTAVGSGIVRAGDPPQAARAGMRVFHDRAAAFVDAQLQVLRETGKWQGEEVAIVFLGIFNPWDEAWELTLQNFDRGARVIAIPTYNLPWEKMDLPGAVLDYVRTAFPRTPITTRKIGVPELLEHLARQGVRVCGIGFDSGANFVLQENVSALVHYAQQQVQAQRPLPHIMVNSGAIGKDAHSEHLRQDGFLGKQTGKQALVTAVQQRFSDFDPTGLRVPIFGVPGYFWNIGSALREPFGPERQHGYVDFRNQVNKALPNAACMDCKGDPWPSSAPGAGELVARGAAWRRKGEYDKAIDDCSKALQIDPKNAFAFAVRGATKRAKGNFDEAIAGFSKVIRMAPARGVGYYARADILVLMQRQKQAAADYKEAMRRGLVW